MKQRIHSFIQLYLLFVLLFVVQKPLFMFYHFSLFKETDWTDWFAVMRHGLPLDLSMSGYLTAVPLLALIVSIWINGRWFARFMNVYTGLIVLLLSVIFISDLELYRYWGFRLDSTPLFYLASPADAAASVPTRMLILAPLAILIYFAICWWPLRRWSLSTEKWPRVNRRVGSTLSGLLIAGGVFIAIRGGVSVSTMNVGKVYFSPDLYLNHAAVNPAFSLISSLAREQKFGDQYRYVADTEADRLFETLKGGTEKEPVPPTDSTRYIKENPNLVFIVLESFTGKAVEALGGEKGVTPHLDRLAAEGLLFTRFYANSFRTDRGLVSIFSGYPAQPTTSIMKYPAKSQTLPSISKTLSEKGYDLEWIYGGDADFTNMRSYFMSAGFDRIICDRDFPIQQRLSKWGADDEITFDKLYRQIDAQQQQPFMKFLLTLSSHEPFEVPLQKFEDKYLNSVAYTDSCLGLFIDRLKASSSWDNTLLILLPDHGFRYPDTLANHAPERHHIPMIWAGGALLRSGKVETLASQIDLAATLLGQLGLPYDDFTFSKNIFARPDSAAFAFYTFKNGFGYIDRNGAVVYDCDADTPLWKSSPDTDTEERNGKILLQKLYDDLDRR